MLQYILGPIKIYFTSGYFWESYDGGYFYVFYNGKLPLLVFKFLVLVFVMKR